MATLNRKMKQRRGIAADWVGVVPHDGEFIVETDTGYIRVGDGSTNAEDLPILNKATAVPVFDTRVAKTGAYTVVAADRGKVIDATSGTWTLSLTAAATLGDGFSFAVFNSGAGVVTIDPDGAETIRDAFGSSTTRTLAQGEGGIVFCDGSSFNFMKVTAGNATLSSLGAILNARQAQAAAYTVVVTDKGKLFDATAGTWTLSLDPAATLGDGFTFAVFNSGSGVITIDPDGAETIRDAAGSAATKTLAQGEGGVVFCTGTSFLFLKTAVGSAATLVSLGAIFNSRSAKTGAYTVVAGDKGKLFDTTSGTFTLSLDPAAALGDGFNFAVFNSGSGVITLDPDGAETIRDATSSATTKTLAQGEAGILFCDGTGWFLLKIAATGAGGGTKTIARWAAKLGDPYLTSFGTYYVVNNFPVLEFDPSGLAISDQRVFFMDTVPEGASTANGLRVIIKWRAKSATSGTVALKTAFGICENVDLDTDSFGTEKTSSADSANATLGKITTTTIDHSSGEIDSLVAGALFRLRLTLAAANQSMTGGIQVLHVEVQTL